MSWAKQLPIAKQPASDSMKPDAPTVTREVVEPVEVRRWDGARVDRLNADQWAHVSTWKYRSINDDLRDDLDNLIARCAHEIANNPMLAGCVETHVTDIVGQDGPRLNIISDDQQYNAAVEDNWHEFFKMPDANGQVNGVAMLSMYVRQLWSYGRIVNQLVSVPREGDFSVGVRLIEPSRLSTPTDKHGDPLVAFGVQTNEQGRPLGYWIRRRRNYGSYSYGGDEWDYLDADVVQHAFIRHEPDQITGYPLASTVLGAAGDLRQYDAEVLEAARQAATQGVFWYTEHPDAAYDASNQGCRPIERGMQVTGPPGWRPQMLQSSQPTAQYKDFHHERLRELGRTALMGLTQILQSSAQQNMASAHHDGLIYRRGLGMFQGFFEREILNEIVDIIGLETRLANGWERPRKVRYEWVWSKPPHADPVKHYNAIRARLEDGTISYRDAAGEYGYDIETLIQMRAIDKQLLEEADLPPTPVNLGNQQIAGTGLLEGNDDETQPSDSEADDETGAATDSAESGVV